MGIALLIIGLIAGAAIGWYVSQSKMQLKISEVRENYVPKPELEKERAKVLELTGQVKAQETMQSQFENVAGKILDERSAQLDKENKSSIDIILNPLKTTIESFQKRVDTVHSEHVQSTASLIGQIKVLRELNTQISKDAVNLTKALKGETKLMGDWGEDILERILEYSGLKKDIHYRIQASLSGENGRQLRPDVIIDLPEGRHVVVDSKVSITAYVDSTHEEDADKKVSLLGAHITSVKNHINNLSQKNYQQLYQLNTLDFVIMFVPNETAYFTAMEFDKNLWNYAYERHIVLLGPANLIPALRLIQNLWNTDNQNRNALEIARQCGDLYDKFVGLANDLIDVGRKMDTAKDSYSEAMKKLTEGKGNLVSRIENIKKLGAKASKSIPQQLIDRAESLVKENENVS
jgi:DNA recombination protein RmuC